MRQSHRHHLPATGPRGRHEPVGETTSAPVHCGRPMVVRRLDVLHPESSANRMILDVAVTGRCVHACRCGFLLESPPPTGRPSCWTPRPTPGSSGTCSCGA